MASFFRAAAGRMSGTTTPNNEAADSDAEEPHAVLGKYLLSITAGPSYDLATHSPVFVNTDTPTLVDNEFLTAKIKVRVRGYDGLPKGSQATSTYFDDAAHTSDMWSIGFSFVPKTDIPADQTVWGTTFDHPVRDRLPPRTLVDMGWRIFKSFIDPGVEMDAYADEPYLLGPTLSTWFVFRIGETLAEGQDPKDHAHPSESSPLEEGADGSSAQAVRDKFDMPGTWNKRRKHFLTPKNREGFVYEANRLYSGDFHNPYIDLAQFKVKLPGLSISVAKYINDKTHVLRWVFLNKVTGDVYFVVCFTLLHGGDVDDAVERDEKRVEEAKQSKTDPGSVEGASSSSAQEPRQQLEPNQAHRDTSTPEVRTLDGDTFVDAPENEAQKHQAVAEVDRSR